MLNKGTTGTIFITSLVWRGPWLGIEPGTSKVNKLDVFSVPVDSGHQSKQLKQIKYKLGPFIIKSTCRKENALNCNLSFVWSVIFLVLYLGKVKHQIISSTKDLHTKAKFGPCTISGSIMAYFWNESMLMSCSFITDWLSLTTMHTLSLFSSIFTLLSCQESLIFCLWHLRRIVCSTYSKRNKTNVS